MEPNQEGKITERQFAKMLLSYAGMSDQKQKKMLKRVKERFVGKASKVVRGAALFLLIVVDQSFAGNQFPAGAQFQPCIQVSAQF